MLTQNGGIQHEIVGWAKRRTVKIDDKKRLIRTKTPIGGTGSGVLVVRCLRGRNLYQQEV